MATIEKREAITKIVLLQQDGEGDPSIRNAFQALVNCFGQGGPARLAYLIIVSLLTAGVRGRREGERNSLVIPLPIR